MSGKKRKIPKWTKAPEALVALFAGAIEGLPGVEAKKMFGYPAAFVNGNMFASLFQSSMILRLSENDRRECGAKAFEPMPGRPMREYIAVPDRVLGSPKLLGDWLRKGHGYASSMPPKSSQKKPTKSGAQKR